MERLRPILGSKRWDYCVLWKLSEDGRFVEWVDCCCGGSTHGVGDDQEQLAFPFSCKDAIFQHPRTKSCDLLAQLPSSIPFDSGIHAQTMISNQARWLNFSDNSVSEISHENVWTRVLIPVPVGLVELFIAKQVSEDPSIIDLVASHFNLSMEQNYININTISIVDPNLDHQNNPNVHKFQLPISPPTMLENTNDKNVFFDGTSESYGLNGFDQEIGTIQRQVMSENMNVNVMGRGTLETKKRKGGVHKDARIVNCSDSLSESNYSDLNDEDIEPKHRRRKGKGPSKNLVAERNRRMKLNDRLYALRALVPKISKLDRASILGDAIEYMMELQRQVEDLQNELEEHSDDEGDTNNRSTITQQEIRQGKRPKSACVMFSNGSHLEGPTNVDIIQELKNPNEHKNQQMEPQVEADQLEDGNEFLVKVFCEHKPGGFVKLMEAFTSLGLEVTNVNVNSFRSLVMNVFKVEKRDSEMVEAEHVRESLLELTRHQPRVSSEVTTTNRCEDCRGGGHHDNHHIYEYDHHSHLHPQLHHHHPYHLHN